MCSVSLKNKRGQVRAIDFTVSLVLFLIVLSQLLLIVINVQIIISQQDDVILPEVGYLAQRITHFEGSHNWGYETGLPLDFGLARANVDHYHIAVLDLPKYSRLNSELGYLFTEGYAIREYVTPSYIKEKLEMDSLDFSILTEPVPTLSVSTSSNSTAGVPHAYVSVYATTTRNRPISKMNVTIFQYFFENGSLIPLSNELTSYLGFIEVEFPYDQNSPCIIICVGHIGNMWTLNWAEPEYYFQGSYDIQRKDILSDFTIGSDGKAEFRDVAAVSSIESHSFTACYQNSSKADQFGLSIIDVDTTTSATIDKTFEIPPSGFIWGITSAYTISTAVPSYRFNIVSLPGFFNKITETADGMFPVYRSADAPDITEKRQACTNFFCIIHGVVVHVTFKIWEVI